MSTIKKFLMYILLLVAIYIFVSILSYIFINNAYKNIEDYEILTQSPKIEIVESKSTYVNGYVIANITNNTGANIEKTYLKLDLYTENDNYLGSKYNEIDDFSNNETVEVKTNYKFNGVEKYKVSLVNNVANNITYSEDDKFAHLFFHMLGISGILMIIYYIL